MEGNEHHLLVVTSAIFGTIFSALCVLSFSVLWAVNWRPWRIYSWIFARKWPGFLLGPQLSILSGFLFLVAWIIVISPIIVVITWGSILITTSDRDIIGLAVIMAGTALLLAFYSIMLWWRTQWQSSRAVAVLLLLAMALLCAYELCAVFITTGSNDSESYSPSGFFFGISAIALAINMLFICRMVFNGNGLDVDEYVRKSYKFAYADCIEVGPMSSVLEPPDPNDLYVHKSSKASHLGLLYFGSLLVLLIYSILYGLMAKESRWLGAVTSAAVIVLDWNMGACLFGFELLKSRVAALFVAGVSRVFLICFGVHYWYLGHCISYTIVASVLSGAAVSRHLSASNPLAERHDALKSTVIRLREGFRRKDHNSSSASSEGGRSSVKCSSSSVEAAQLGRPVSQNNSQLVDNERMICDNSDSGRRSIAVRTSSCRSVQEPENSASTCQAAIVPSNSSESTASGAVALPNQLALELSLAQVFQERLNDPRIASMIKKRARLGDRELGNLLLDKGLDPNFEMMLKDKGLDPTILALLQRSSLDADRDHGQAEDPALTESDRLDLMFTNQVSFSEELRRHGFGKWMNFLKLVLHYIAGTPERAWVLFSFLFILETVVVAVFRPRTIKLINATHEQFEFGFSVLLLSPVVCSIMAFLWSLHAEEMAMTSKPKKFGCIAWLLSTSVGLLLSFLSKSSILLGLALTLPLMMGCLAFAVPIWMHNGYRFHISKEENSNRQNIVQCNGKKEGIVLTISSMLFAGLIIALGAIISSQPLGDTGYKGWNESNKIVLSPYTSPTYIGWAMSSMVTLLVTCVLPITTWFGSYRFSFSSAICVGIFTVVLVTFCGGSYLGVINAREGGVPVKADFLAALLPLLCIPAIISLFIGLYQWKDDNWNASRGVCAFVGVGFLLLLGGISAVIVTIKPWTVGVAFLLVILLVILAFVVIVYWASNNYYLTRAQTFFVCFIAFMLALAALCIGIFHGNPFVGGSVGYFSFLFLLAGRALTVLLSPPIVVYSPRVLPVYVYDAHADTAKNVSGAFLVLYGVALATEGWGVVASLRLHPPFAGAAVSAITLVVSFGFAVSRSSLTLKTMEDAIHFLSKDTVIQAISRAANKTRNTLSGTYSAPQRSASSAALLVGDPTIARDRTGNFVLPRADVTKLRDRLRNEEIAAGLTLRKGGVPHRHDSSLDVGCRRQMCAHARILALEEAIDTEWVYMWDKFGGYLLLLLGLTAKAERVQDEVRLRLFLDSIGFSDLSANNIKKWLPEDRRQFELIQDSYIREREIEEEILMQRRGEEGKGKERRKALLEKEERKLKEIECSLLSSLPNSGNRDAAAMAAAVRAVGGDSLLDDTLARERISSIALRIRTAQLGRRAQQTGVQGAVCILDDEPCGTARNCGKIDRSLCNSHRVSFSISVLIQPESGPVCLLGTECQKKVCWEILVAGAEQGFESGQVGLRLVTKGDRATTVAKDWSIGATSIADGRWHIVTVTIDAELGEATCYLDGGFDGYQNGLNIQMGAGIWENDTDLWIGTRAPMDLDAFGRSDSESIEAKMQVMDAFLWGKCLTEDEISAFYSSISPVEFYMSDLPECNLPPADSPPRGNEWESEEAEIDLYDREDIDWDGQFSSGRKRRSDREGVVIEMETFSRKLRKPKLETKEEMRQRMLSIELAVKEALYARGEAQFTDQEFPPNERSLFVDPDNPPSKLQVVSQWMRPIDIVKESCKDANPCLFSGPVYSSDVCQGRLGDCWFLSAVAVLTESSRISEIIITPEFNTEGVYTVRFCIQGEWVPVIVDDWLPCESPGKPAFATSRKRNELWVSILEKAYAKLHGSYEALEGGLVQDALVDLTGGAGEEIDLRSGEAQIDLASGRLWSQLLRFKQEGFLLGAGSPSGSDVHVSSSGIVQGHAYSLLQIREVDGHKLVQIRNPWANEVEWNGPWSDSSDEWTDRIKHKLKYVPQSKEGIFWMSWQDFQVHFRSIYICRLYPPEMCYSVRGQWRGYSAGGCQEYGSWHQNPQFRLKVVNSSDATSPIHVFITLTQGVSFSRKAAGFENFQSSHNSELFYIGMRILKTNGCRVYNIYMHETVGGSDYVNLREISYEVVLEPHRKGYTIVPSTLHPCEEAPFVLSVFTNADITLEAL